MARKLPLTLACGDYEITRPLMEGTVEPDGIELTVLTDMDSGTRHWRFLRGREFDVAEVSCSSYLIARDQGLPFVAIPVFPHRRFRHGFIYVNTTKGIAAPRDLIGKRIGVKQFQSSAIVWLRGILASEYGVPQESIEWFSELDESIAFEPPPGLKVSRLPDGALVEDLLAKGELDAALHPELIGPIVKGDPRVARLFADPRAEEEAYYRKTGIFPIMHVVGIRREVHEAHPWIASTLYQAFDAAKSRAMRRMRNPRIVPLVFYTDALEEQERTFGKDPWEYGLSPRNRKTLEAATAYAHQQGLTKRRLPVDELFVGLTENRQRGI
ncbi:MAG: ABC transporter substrate-binding protein [Gemmatimonas sp.]